MKATLTFDMDDPEDKMAHARCVKALDMALFISNLMEYLRRKSKDSTETLVDWDSVREGVTGMLNDRDINMDELIN